MNSSTLLLWVLWLNAFFVIVLKHFLGYIRKFLFFFGTFFFVSIWMFDDLFCYVITSLTIPFLCSCFLRPFTLPSILSSTKQNKPIRFLRKTIIINQILCRIFFFLSITFLVNIEIFIWDDESPLCKKPHETISRMDNAEQWYPNQFLLYLCVSICVSILCLCY